MARMNNNRLKKLLRIEGVASTNNAIELSKTPTIPTGRFPQFSIHQAQSLTNLFCSDESSTSSQVMFVSFPIL